MLNLYRKYFLFSIITALTVAANEFPIRHDRQVAVGSTVELTCDLTKGFGTQVKWRKYQGVLNGYSRVYNGKLIIPNVRLYDTGAYECFLLDGRFKRINLDVKTAYELEKIARDQVKMSEPEIEDDGEISDENLHEVVEHIQPKPEPTVPYEKVFNKNYTVFFVPCAMTEATCRNGQCISRDGLCDGKSDCTDGSDETFCSSGYTSNKCEPNERPCRSDGKCIQKIWFCDGEKDCDDGSDEQCSDAATVSNGLCKSNEVPCRDQKQCILKSFLCDKEFDCRDHSDEIGCIRPTITQQLNRNLTVVIGGTFKLQCKAKGWPHPYINWRLNWGHVCEEPRCFSTNADGCGILTVTDARLTDAGAYSCEAINSEGRVFAVPDTLVDVDQHQGQRNPEALTCGPAPLVTRPPEPVEEQSECECNNHSEDCTCSGYCLRCQHNTMGEQCELCMPGFTGDATRGTPFDCLPTGQTISTTTERPVEIVEQVDCHCNNHTVDCTCSGYCLNCDHNTMGKYCHLCKPGFTGDATKGTTHDCLPVNGLVCNPYGTKSSTEMECICKRGVTGTLCEKCKPSYFNLIENINSRQGCLSCFCNGLSVDCSSSVYTYGLIMSDFEAEFSDWYVSNKFTKINDSINFNFEESAISYDGFEKFEKEEVYFIVPSKYKGNKLNSYGGNLAFKFKYTNPEGDEDLNFQNLELRLSGSSINIIHKYNKPIKQNIMNEIVIQLHEDQFRRYGDNGVLRKEFMLMALSNIEIIMLKAKVSSNQNSVMLKDFSMDLANEETVEGTNDLINRAMYIEVCECPEGYTGTSCQVCAPGYKRSMQGFYWGLCELEQN